MRRTLLDEKKHEVMKLMDRGFSNARIAEVLGTSPRTVDRFVVHHWEWLKHHYIRGKSMEPIILTKEESQRIERLLRVEAMSHHQELSRYYHVELDDVRGELGVAAAEVFHRHDPARGESFDNLLRGAFRVQMKSFERRLLAS